MRQDMLDAMDANLYRPESGGVLDGDTIVPTSPTEGFEDYIQAVQQVVNDQDALKNLLYPHAIFELLMHNYFKPEELTTKNIPQILNEYQKMQISLARILQAREKGDYQYERTFEIAPQKIVEHTLSTKQSSLLLSEFIEQYIETKLRDAQWKPHSAPDHRNRLENLVEILGDKPINTVTREDMRNYRDILSKLPPNRKKSPLYRGKNIQEILAMAPAKTLVVKTVNTAVEAAASMFQWGIREGILDTNPARSLQFSDNRQSIELKEPFTAEDIKKLFFSGSYTEKAFKNLAYYWVPLIGLYSGLRLEEICQLHCDDIVSEDGIWYFDINEES